MADLRAEEDHLDDVDDFLELNEQLQHLRTRRRGNAIVIESGPKNDRAAHARLRRTTVHRWSLEIADHRGRWEPTPYTDELESLLTRLVSNFPWVLEPRD
jgi:hypothetical protein